MPAIPVKKSILMTTSGSFNPATDGQGRTVFTVRWGAGGGGGHTPGGAGGGQGQIFELQDVTVSSAVIVTIGAGGPAGNVGGDTTLAGGFVAVARGGTPASSAVGGRTYAPGSRAGTANPILVTTGGSNGAHGKDGVMNPAGIYLSTDLMFIGGVQLSPGGIAGAGGAGAGGYQGAGGAYGANGIGYSSGGGGDNGSGKAGFVEFIWQ